MGAATTKAIGLPNNLSIDLQMQYHTQFNQAKILFQLKITVQSASTFSQSPSASVLLHQQECQHNQTNQNALLK